MTASRSRLKAGRHHPRGPACGRNALVGTASLGCLRRSHHGDFRVSAVFSRSSAPARGGDQWITPMPCSLRLAAAGCCRIRSGADFMVGTSTAGSSMGAHLARGRLGATALGCVSRVAAGTRLRLPGRLGRPRCWQRLFDVMAGLPAGARARHGGRARPRPGKCATRPNVGRSPSSASLKGDTARF